MAGFTPNSIKRIAAVVKQVEGTPRNNVGDSRGRSPKSGREFWAKLTGNDTLDDGRHKYSWQAVLLDADGFKDYEDDTDTRSGDLEPGDDGIARYAIDVTEWNSDPGEALDDDRVVRMFLDYYTDESGTTLPRYTFASGGGSSRSVLVKITGNAEGSGKYLGKLVTPPTYDITATSNLSTSDFGVVDESSYVIALNAADLGWDILSATAIHQIDLGSVVPGTLLRTQADGTLIVAINAFGFNMCVNLPDDT